MFIAALSSLSLALMVIFDKLMIKDCYGGNVRHAIFISSVAGVGLGVLSTAILWGFSTASLTALWELLVNILDPYGFLIMLAGLMSSQVLYHYFNCFSEEADSTVMASWLAATPIFVYLGAYLLSLLGLLYEPMSFSLAMGGAVLVTGVSLSLLERLAYRDDGEVAKYRKHLFLMLFFNTAYVLLIDQTIAHATLVAGHPNTLFVPAVLPMFWLGFAAGMRFLLPLGERRSLLSNDTIGRFLVPIAIVEVFGMFVFFFEFLGLGQTDSVTVSVIVSLHVIVVWLASVLLSRYGTYLLTSGKDAVAVRTIAITSETLTSFSLRRGTWYLQLALVLLTVVGVTMFFLLAEL